MLSTEDDYLLALDKKYLYIRLIDPNLERSYIEDSIYLRYKLRIHVTAR